MTTDIERKTNAILKIIAETKEPIGSAEIAKLLKKQGIDLSERTVRYHLKLMSESGLAKVLWKEGRVITQKGIEELNNAFVSDKVGLMSTRMGNMAYQMDFDIYKRQGSVILNVSFIPVNDFKKALKIMAPVFEQKIATGDKVFVGQPGYMIGPVEVPAGKIGFGTVCTININGILLKHSIPVESRFGGLVQWQDGRPIRFTDIIHYDGTTLDPHELFVKSRMTNVCGALIGKGKILAGMREIPNAARDEAEAIIRKIETAGIGRVLMIGQSGQALLGMPVSSDRVGIIVPGGLNPIAAVEESGIETESRALSCLVEYSKLVGFSDI